MLSIILNRDLIIELGTSMVDMWYNEVKDYKYGDGFSMKTGHFTQVVWVGSRRIGCGIGVDSRGTKFLGVCRYSPPGNYQGQFAQNVLRP